MPPPRKINLLPSELQAWLKEELKARGFADYDAVTDALNFRLEEEGIEVRVGRTAVHTFGKEYAEFVKYQDEASSWAVGWMQENGLEEEAQRHNVLFQMITTLAFKVMQSQMMKTGDEIDPKELHFLGKMLKDVMASSGIRQKLLEEERARIAQEARVAAVEDVATAALDLGMSAELIQKIRGDVLGVRT